MLFVIECETEEFLPIKGTLHQGLKVKKLNDFSNLKSVVSFTCFKIENFQLRRG